MVWNSFHLGGKRGCLRYATYIGVCWGSLRDEFLLITNPQELYEKKKHQTRLTTSGKKGRPG